MPCALLMPRYLRGAPASLLPFCRHARYDVYAMLSLFDTLFHAAPFIYDAIFLRLPPRHFAFFLPRHLFRCFSRPYARVMRSALRMSFKICYTSRERLSCLIQRHYFARGDGARCAMRAPLARRGARARCSLDFADKIHIFFPLIRFSRSSFSDAPTPSA